MMAPPLPLRQLGLGPAIALTAAQTIAPAIALTSAQSGLSCRKVFKCWPAIALTAAQNWTRHCPYGGSDFDPPLPLRRLSPD